MISARSLRIMSGLTEDDEARATAARRGMTAIDFMS